MKTEFTDEDIYRAQEFTCSNKAKLQKEGRCGCYSCLKLFSTGEIRDFKEDDTEENRAGTALCPYCGKDTVIGAYTGFPMTEEFLEAMQEVWG